MILADNPLVLGRTAQIYAWGDQQIVKLYYEWFSPASVQHEAQVSLAVDAGSGQGCPLSRQVNDQDKCYQSSFPLSPSFIGD